MFGVGDKSLMDKLVAGKLSFYVGPGDNLVDFVSVEDVAMGHVLAAGKGGTHAPVSCTWIMHL
ncbi:hypothetical protein SARC_15205, partial [Sphaeroforma arctica JP610]